MASDIVGPSVEQNCEHSTRTGGLEPWVYMLPQDGQGFDIDEQHRIKYENNNGKKKGNCKVKCLGCTGLKERLAEDR